jgi:lipopolysaccharide/colanic/teichoic acid biosynthesis glycosyltransferase
VTDGSRRFVKRSARWRADQQGSRSSNIEGDGTAVSGLNSSPSETYELQISDPLPPPHFGYRAAKRAIDLAASLALLFILSPLLIVLACIVAITSPGPVFFRQERVGIHGRPFRMTKFRSMVADAEALAPDLIDRAEHGEFSRADVPIFKSEEDPRVTWIGRHLRRFSLDELPQLYDVLTGEMSLVGPRPLVISEARLLPESAQLRHLVKPGITCTWQTSHRSEVTYDERIAMDLDYARRRSLWLDLVVLAKTPAAVVRGDGAY